MRYDGANELHAAQARSRLEKLIRDKKVFDLTEKKPQRSINQNAYLWLTISYWGVQAGYTKDESEAVYKNVNKDIYYVKKELAGENVIYVRHTYELDTAEMSASIEKWRNWAAQNESFPVYIPSPDEYKLVSLMEIEVERNKQYL